MMDGASSTNPKRVQDSDGDMKMQDVSSGGDGKGQSEAQIAEQQRRVDETSRGLWDNRAQQAGQAA
jgi:calcium/calmodulin-dependent protein kinase I